MLILVVLLPLVMMENMLLVAEWYDQSQHANLKRMENYLYFNQILGPL